jgi:hypothetical protein
MLVSSTCSRRPSSTREAFVETRENLLPGRAMMVGALLVIKSAVRERKRAALRARLELD